MAKESFLGLKLEKSKMFDSDFYAEIFQSFWIFLLISCPQKSLIYKLLSGAGRDPQ